jgi:hypothetical protein
MPDGSLHLIVDVWTSKQQQAVLGFKVQFIKDWILRTLVLGFKHFPEKHTGENIREKLIKILEESYSIRPQQVI